MLHEISTRLNTKNTPAPDVAFWTFDRKPGRNRKAASLPDLAIEVWSEHDWETQQRLDAARQKCRRYIETGVKVVWAINPRDQLVEIYRSGQTEPEIVTIDGILGEETLMPGFQIAVRMLFEG
jgi:Uma2 family endonuclease